MNARYIAPPVVLGPLVVFDVANVDGRLVLITQQPHFPRVEFSKLRVNGKRACEIYSNTGFEPSTVLYFDIVGDIVMVSYCGSEIQMNVNRYSSEAFEMVSGTVCKTDFLQARNWVNYHQRHGVEHCYIYYNGHLTDEVISSMEGLPVTIIQWTYPYWIEKDERSLRERRWICTHGCQPPALAHMFHVTGRSAKWIMNHDLDEYVVSDRPLRQMLDSDVVILRRQNVWIEGMNPVDMSTWLLVNANASDELLLPKYVARVDRVDIPRIHDCISRKAKVQESENAYIMHLAQNSGTRKERVNYNCSVQLGTINPLIVSDSFLLGKNHSASGNSRFLVKSRKVSNTLANEYLELSSSSGAWFWFECSRLIRRSFRYVRRLLKKWIGARVWHQRY